MKKVLFTILCSLPLLLCCGKDFLDEKREANQVIPADIYDYQALLDNSTVMNKQAAFRLMTIGSDEYSYPQGVWETLSPISYYYLKNGYIWSEDVYEGKDVPDWNNAYQTIMYANLALDAKEPDSGGSGPEDWKNVRGQALFHRSFAYYQLVQTFCRPYDPNTARSDRGIPLRLDYDVTSEPSYGSVEDIYNRIIADLAESAALLPMSQATNYRPSKLSSYALMARIFREMNRWDEALEYADRILSVKKDLLDYNKVNAGATYPFDAMKKGMDNKEILFYCQSFGAPIMSKGEVNQNILDSYEANDLRKNLYFKNGKRFYGSYAGSIFFNGLAMDEVFLIRAEARLRKGQNVAAKSDLEFLLTNRYKNGEFGILPSDEGLLLDRISKERIKELYMRGTRWSDIRQQNLKDGSKVVLTRQAAAQEYILLPDDPRWTWQWPDSEKAK